MYYIEDRFKRHFLYIELQLATLREGFKKNLKSGVADIPCSMAYMPLTCRMVQPIVFSFPRGKVLKNCLSKKYFYHFLRGGGGVRPQCDINNF